MPLPADEWFGPSRVRSTGIAGLPIEEFFSLGMAQAPTTPAAPPIEPGAFTSLKRGTLVVGESFMNAGQLFGQAMQNPTVADYFARKAEDLKIAQEKYPRAVPTIE